MTRLPKYHNAFFALLAAVAFLLLHSCASMGTPSGGPRDEDPPRFVKANYPSGTTGITPKQINLDFNEIVNVKDAFTNVVVSPTSDQMVRVSSQGRRVIVQLPDSLVPNTTYTVDFGNSIEDNNEGNKLPGFSYTFSTGPTLDTLRIAGIVLGAKDLEPQKQVVVGVHSLTADSVFKTQRLERVAKTDDRGRFIIRGLAPGAYRVFALGDVNNDYRWDNPEELIGFYDTMVSPTTERIEVSDTIYNFATAQVDTILPRVRTRYLPNDLLIPYFAIDYKPQYITNYTRVDSTRIQVILNAPTPQPATLDMTEPPMYEKFYRLDRSERNDTLTFWLEPRDLIATDTLNLALNYQRVTAAGQIENVTDTLEFVTNRPKVIAKKEKKKKKDEEEATDSIVPPTPHIDMTIVSSLSQEVFAPVLLEFSTPLDTIFADRFHLAQKVDTVWKPLVINPVRADSASLRRYKIEYPWEYGETYKLTVDTLAAIGIYGLTPKPLEQELHVRKENDYSHLRLQITGLNDTVPAIVELLNTSDQPVRRVRVVNGDAIFTNLNAGTYYARLFEDRNDNGRYDVGNYELWQQPEATYYYPKKIELKKNWEVTQAWDLNALPIDAQKPDAIKKNKPDQPKNQRRKKQQPSDDEEE